MTRADYRARREARLEEIIELVTPAPKRTNELLEALGISTTRLTEVLRMGEARGLIVYRRAKGRHKGFGEVGLPGALPPRSAQACLKGHTDLRTHVNKHGTLVVRCRTCDRVGRARYQRSAGRQTKIVARAQEIAAWLAEQNGPVPISEFVGRFVVPKGHQIMTGDDRAALAYLRSAGRLETRREQRGRVRIGILHLIDKEKQ